MEAYRLRQHDALMHAEAHGGSQFLAVHETADHRGEPRGCAEALRLAPFAAGAGRSIAASVLR